MKHSWENAKFDFRGIPTHCSNCGSKNIRYTSNAEIYNGKQYEMVIAIYVMIVKLV